MIRGSRAEQARRRRAQKRLSEQTRRRFALGEDGVVLVSELTCALPGCPPLETVVVFWTADGVRHRFKIFKPVLQITADDLPYAWLMRALAAPEGFDEDCC
jgi:hypothetical protein